MEKAKSKEQMPQKGSHSGLGNCSGCLFFLPTSMTKKQARIEEAQE